MSNDTMRLIVYVVGLVACVLGVGLVVAGLWGDKS